MDWNIIWNWVVNLGVFSVGTASMTAVIGFFGKSIFQTYLTKQTEAYKSELQRITNQHQITFSKLHADRADTIKELYPMLVKLERSVNSLTVIFKINISADVVPDTGEIGENYEKFSDYYMINKIYFSEPICKLIDTINEKFVEVIIKYDTYGYEKSKQIKKDLLIQNLKSVEEQIPLLKNKLENEFRILLGVTDEKK
ncbi:hypothetical protein [Bacillus cereus]